MALRSACTGDQGLIVNFGLKDVGHGARDRLILAFCKTVAAFAHVSSIPCCVCWRKNKGKKLRTETFESATATTTASAVAGPAQLYKGPLCASIDFSIASDQKKIPEETRSEPETTATAKWKSDHT
jgi:hypothetical protein